MIWNDPLPSQKVPVGTMYTITASGPFTVPATGRYDIELHGGGGGGASGWRDSNHPLYGWIQPRGGGGGGGSGEIFRGVELKKGEVVKVTIGRGGLKGIPHEVSGDGSVLGVTGCTGDYTYFGSYFCAGGGGGGREGFYGSAAGSIATDGRTGEMPDLSATSTASGGAGGKGGSAANYGDGGSGGSDNSDWWTPEAGESGKDGAVILTYRGK